MLQKVFVVLVLDKKPPQGAVVTVTARARHRPKNMPQMNPTPYKSQALTPVDGSTTVYSGVVDIRLPQGVPANQHKRLLRVEAVATIGGMQKKLAIIDTPSPDHS